MKFGKLSDISQVDFTLPSDPEGNQLVLNDLKNNGTCDLYIGATGWSMKAWEGKIYPPKTKSTDYLHYYSRQYGTIELNTTHYRIPTIETIEKWYKQSPDDFRFCPKIPQTISHGNNLGLNDSNLDLFCESIRGLGEKLGCCFIQLPPYFDLARLPVLENFLGRFPQDIPLAVEVRHTSFFENQANAETYFKLLETYDRSAVITDVAGRRDVLHMRITNQRTMVRFVGNGLVDSDYRRMDNWVERMAEWAMAGLNEIYFFPHEPDNVLAPEISVYLSDILSQKDHFNFRGLKLLDDKHGQQITLF